MRCAQPPEAAPPNQTKEPAGLSPGEALEAIRDYEGRYITALNKNAACPHEPEATKSFSEHVENVLKHTQPIVAPYKYGASKGRAARYCLPGHHYCNLILLCGREYFRCDNLFKIQSSVFCVLQSISSTNGPRFRSSEKQYNRRKSPSAAAASAGRQKFLKCCRCECPASLPVKSSAVRPGFGNSP
jgi:hypothetical protein